MEGFGIFTICLNISKTKKGLPLVGVGYKAAIFY
jgi:hypothetical protein